MFSAQLDPRSVGQFDDILRRMADATGRPVEDILRQQGRLLARDLAHWINPVGLTPSLGRSFADSIASSVARFYRPVGWLHREITALHGQPAADHLIKTIRTGAPAEAQRRLNSTLRLNHPGAITVGPFDGGALHRRHRWRRGTRRHPIHIVTDWPAAAAYIRETSRRAGLAKSALIQAGKMLDGKTAGVPAWITRHLPAPGHGRITNRGKRGFIGEIKSNLRYAREALPFDKELRALDYREAVAARLLQRIVDDKLRKALARQRRITR